MGTGLVAIKLAAPPKAGMQIIWAAFYCATASVCLAKRAKHHHTSYYNLRPLPGRTSVEPGEREGETFHLAA